MTPPRGSKQTQRARVHCRLCTGRIFPCSEVSPGLLACGARRAGPVHGATQTTQGKIQNTHPVLVLVLRLYVPRPAVLIFVPLKPLWCYSFSDHPLPRAQIPSIIVLQAAASHKCSEEIHPVPPCQIHSLQRQHSISPSAEDIYLFHK